MFYSDAVFSHTFGTMWVTKSGCDTATFLPESKGVAGMLLADIPDRCGVARRPPFQGATPPSGTNLRRQGLENAISGEFSATQIG
jgi:hypothetical protein